MKAASSFIIFASWMASSAQAFSLEPPKVSTATAAATQTTTALSSRRSFLDKAVVGAALTAATIVAQPQNAFADITSQLKSTPALRAVKRGQKQLNKLESSVLLKEYAPIKEGLRTAPLGEIRKNASTVVKAADGMPGGEPLQGLYTKFISSLERVDALTGQTIRGRSGLDEQIAEAYAAACVALEEFIKVAGPVIEPISDTLVTASD